MRVEVKFEIEIPDTIAATNQQLEEWLRFSLNDNGTIRNDNPLLAAGVTAEPVFGTFRWDAV